MEQIYPALDQLISEMSDGDLDFQKQLTMAIYKGLVELKEKYQEGSLEKDEHKIQQIRHKLKPTLSMFELNQITDELQHGKDIIEGEGFDATTYKTHYNTLLGKVDDAIKRVRTLMV